MVWRLRPVGVASRRPRSGRYSRYRPSLDPCAACQPIAQTARRRGTNHLVVVLRPLVAAALVMTVARARVRPGAPMLVAVVPVAAVRGPRWAAGVRRMVGVRRVVPVAPVVVAAGPVVLLPAAAGMVRAAMVVAARMGCAAVVVMPLVVMRRSAAGVLPRAPAARRSPTALARAVARSATVVALPVATVP